MSNSAQILANDNRYEAFRREDFDAGQFTSRALSGAISSAQTTSHQLREDIKTLEDGIRQEVLQKRNQLQEVVTDLNKTETACISVEETINGLNKTVVEMQSVVQGPCVQLREKTQQLKNLRETINVLRVVTKRLRLVQKLKNLVGESDPILEGVDLAEVARLLSELEESGVDVDLSGIHILQEDTQFLATVGQQVRKNGELALMKGQEMLDQAEVGNALQVFFNLHELASAVEMIISKKISKLSQKARVSFDFHKLMPGGVSGGKSSLQENVWSSLRSLVNELEEDTTSVWHLQEVLSKKTDPVSQIMFSSVLDHGANLLDGFWTTTSGILERSLNHAVQPGKSTPVREVLVNGFPKLSSILENSVERLAKRFKAKGKPSIVTERHLEELMKSGNQVQTVFSTRSLMHMNESVNSIFSVSGRTLPSSSDVQRLISVFHEEMKQAELSPHAQNIVSKNVATVLETLTQKMELLSASGPELRTVSNLCNASQLRNITLCSNLHEIYRSLMTFTPKLNQTGIGFLTPSLEVLKVISLGLITPIFKAFVEEFEQLILKMHTLSSWSKQLPTSGSTVVSNPSGFLIELGNKLRIFQIEILQKFSPPFSSSSLSFVRSLVKRLCCRLVVFFVRHGSLLRPLGSQGKQQLLLDTFHLETTISDCLLPMHSLGKQGLMLKSFKRLLEYSVEELKKQRLHSELPKHVILYHLFSRCPREVQLPHEKIRLTAAQFSFWLDSHTDQDAVHGIKSALEASASLAQTNPEFQEVYGCMIDICQA